MARARALASTMRPLRSRQITPTMALSNSSINQTAIESALASAWRTSTKGTHAPLSSRSANRPERAQGRSVRQPKRAYSTNTGPAVSVRMTASIQPRTRVLRLRHTHDARKLMITTKVLNHLQARRLPDSRPVRQERRRRLRGVPQAPVAARRPAAACRSAPSTSSTFRLPVRDRQGAGGPDSADRRIQACNFRMAMARYPSPRVPLPEPYVLAARWLSRCPRGGDRCTGRGSSPAG